jgi:predicted RNA binding protein YcfA (HicA-like mRNA interferase family)
MKIPRDVSARQLIKILSKYGYAETRQVGSHIRLTVSKESNSYNITIPNHNPIKIGTLNHILNDVSAQLKISKKVLIDKLI